MATGKSLLKLNPNTDGKELDLVKSLPTGAEDVATLVEYLPRMHKAWVYLIAPHKQLGGTCL